jgi:hypothetical protein
VNNAAKTRINEQAQFGLGQTQPYTNFAPSAYSGLHFIDFIEDA